MGLTVSFSLFLSSLKELLLGELRGLGRCVSGRVQICKFRFKRANTYVVVKTGVGLGTAGITAIILFIFGIDLWFTWALLTFILNYVPYIGSLIATIPPLILGFVTLLLLAGLSC